MDTRFLRARVFPYGWAMVFVIVAQFSFGAEAEAQTITAPDDGATISGTVSIASSVKQDVSWVDFYVDGNYLTSSPPYTTQWDSTSVPDGGHTLSVMAFDVNDTVVGSSAVDVAVSNSGGGRAVTMTGLRNGATVSGAVPVAATVNPAVSWVNFYADGKYLASSLPFSMSWDSTKVADGGHTISITAYDASDNSLGSVSASVNVSNGGGNADPLPVSIQGLTGSAGSIAGADTDPANYGNYNASGGNGLIGGPLLTDVQAASFVVKTQQSNIETGPNGPANADANNYFNNMAATNPNEYLNQINSFRSAWDPGAWGSVIARIDGACQLANPTTAEVIQWATNKWGINPLLGYAEASQEGHWDETALGDNGTSSGVFQVGDRGANHAFPGFNGAGANLARESTCFNADMWAANIYASFHGLDGYTLGGDIGAAIQTWFQGDASSAGSYTDQVYSILSNTSWIDWQFNGVAVPY